MGKLNVVIVNDNPLTLNTLDGLINAGDRLSVIGKVDNDADTINVIAGATPDIVLLYLIMPRVDGISVVEKVKSEHIFLKNPTFVILSVVGGKQMTGDTSEAGANYYLVKSFDKEILVNKIRHIGELPDKQLVGKVLTAPFEPGEGSHITGEEYMREHLKTNITKMLHELGIPTHIKGHQCLRDAIAMLVENQEMMDSTTKILYSAVAERNQITVSRVERIIRHAIEVAWGRGRMETIDEVFGYTISTGEGKPTNSEFIALISDRVLSGYKKTQDKLIRKNSPISEK